MTTMSIVDIDTSGRFRKDLGDLDGLAKSIEKHGLLHPPVVTTSGKLVCGFRRLDAAFRLGWTEIEVRVIDPDDMIEAERDENEVRKEFTVSERVAIAQAIRARIEERRGRPTKNAEVNVQHVAHLPEGQKSREIVAKTAGFGNHETCRQAEKAVEQGSPELVEALDAGSVSIKAAAVVSELPPEEQRETVAKGPKAVKEKAAEIRQGRSKVNGQEVADPPDVAKLRAAGKIADDVVVEIEDPAPAAEPEPVTPEDDSGELSDADWLAALPAHAVLAGMQLKTFEAEALAYRSLEKPRKTFQHHAIRVLNATRRKGPYTRRLARFLKTDHPKHWLVCPTPENGGCSGTGQVLMVGECPKCYGKGYWIK